MITDKKSYNHGLVLGLTMAEVTILIIFVLLLAFAALMVEQRDKRKEAEQIAKVRQETIISLQKKQKQFAEIQKWLPEGKSIEEVQRELVVISETSQRLEEFREAAQEHGFSPEPEAVRDALGKAREYEDHISAGKGTEVPSCWVRDDESIEYIYDINLTPKGLVVRETGLPHRDEERRALKLQNIVLNQDISEASFLSATSNLFEWSRSKKCRFFVRVFDSTGPTEKSIYQSRLKTVEAHFYKKLVSNEVF